MGGSETQASMPRNNGQIHYASKKNPKPSRRRSRTKNPTMTQMTVSAGTRKNKKKKPKLALKKGKELKFSKVMQGGHQNDSNSCASCDRSNGGGRSKVFRRR